MIFLVGEGLAGSDDYGVAGVDSHRVEVFHITNSNGGIVCIPHYLVFDFLIAFDAFFHKYLMNGRKGKGVFHHCAKLGLIPRKAAARSAQGKCGAENDGIADGVCSLNRFFNAVCDLRGNDRLADPLTKLLEKLSVLGAFDAFGVCAEQFDFTLLKHALFGKLHCKVKSGLAADSGNDCVGALVAAYPCHIFEGQRFHINLVGDGGVGHNGGRVGVCENDLVALFFKGEAGLSSGIVKLGCLSDDNGAGAYDKYLFNIRSLRHFPSPLS